MVLLCVHGFSVRVRGLSSVQEGLAEFVAAEQVEYNWDTDEVDGEGKPGTITCFLAYFLACVHALLQTCPAVSS
jgi:hypothetical protein